MLSDVTDFCRMFLFRHPELAPGAASLAVGAGDAQLGRRGQATLVTWMQVLERIPLDEVWSADQRHSRDAAAAIAAVKGLEVRADARLTDQDLGEWQGKAWEDLAREDGERVRAFFSEFGEVEAPGGESLGQAIERVLEWWTDVQAESVGRSLAVVTSGAMITGFVAAMLGMRLSRAVSLQLPSGGFGVIDMYANGARLTTWNPTAVASVAEAPGTAD